MDLDHLAQNYQDLFKRYPQCREILDRCPSPIKSIEIMPLTDDVKLGCQATYDSGYNYHTSTVQHGEVTVEFFDIWSDESDKDTRVTFYIPKGIPGLKEQIKILDMLRQYPFLSELIVGEINDIREDPDLLGAMRCKTHGYDCTQGEHTSWQWYGVKAKRLHELKGQFVRDSAAGLDFLVSVDDISTDLFRDRTIKIYRMEGQKG